MRVFIVGLASLTFMLSACGGETDNETEPTNPSVSSSSSSSSASSSSSSSGAVAVQIPARIESEDYARAFDITPGNEGAAYRKDDTDVQVTGDTAGDYNVGWTDAGEWLEYDIENAAQASYEVLLRVASPSSNSRVKIQINGSDRISVAIDNTGDWQKYITKKVTLGELAAGRHTLKIQVEEGGFNLNWIELTPDSTEPVDNNNPGNTNAESAAELYTKQCAACHGDDGQGGVVPAAIRSDLDRTQLVQIIDTRMPSGNSAACVGECATQLADYILGGYGGYDGSELFLCKDETEDPGPTPLRKLTAIQYKNSIRALFGDSIDLNGFIKGGASDQDIGNAVTSMSLLEVENFASAAEVVGDYVSRNVQSFAPCTDFLESDPIYMWDSGTAGNPNASLNFQGDGHVVLYNGEGKPVWSSGTAGSAARKMVVNDNGALAIYTDTEVLWAKNGDGVGLGTTSENNSLLRFKSLKPGQSLVSDNGLHVLTLQDDGNIVLTSKKRTLTGRSCAAAFLADFGTRIFRSPLTEAEKTALLGVFDVGYVDEDYGEAMGLVVSAMLQAPRFLYIPELGNPAMANEHTMPLTDYELATRLAFTFWNQTPDEALLASAASGELSTEQGLIAEVDRLTSDSRANASFREFMSVWLGLTELNHATKDASLFPYWNSETPKHMQAQADAFFDDMLGRSLEDLFTQSHQSYAPVELSGWYQDARAPQLGLLTLPAVLAAHSKSAESFPIYRGLFVRQDLLCSPLPPAPAGVGEPEPPSEGVSDRERFEQHSKDPACQNCHTAIDDLGFAFEHFDATGRYRDKQGVHEIDATGVLTGTDVDGPFDGLADLTEKFKNSRTVSSCLTQEWFRHTIRRPANKLVDGCSLKKMHDAFESSGNRFEALRASLIDTAAFRMRRTYESGVVAP